MGNIPGNLGAAQAHKAEAKVHQANARVARAQGRAAKGQAYGQAARLEAENEVAGQQAVMNMERLREKETQARGAVQAQRGGSGFTAQGSGSKVEVSVLEAFEQQAQDMAYSRAMQDTSARFNATMARKQGDFAEWGANINADYENSKAEISKIKKRGAYTAAAFEAAAMIVGGAIGGGTGAMMGSAISQSLNRGMSGSVESMSRETAFQQEGAKAMGKGLSQSIDFMSATMSGWLK